MHTCSVRIVRRPIVVRAATPATKDLSKSRESRPENVAGDFFVDHTCIDCDTCRSMAPAVYGRVGDQSAVTHQPTSSEDRVEALKALLSCPTFSIHTAHKSSQELQAAQQALPSPVKGAEGIFFCGWNSEKSFGGNSYLLQRPQGNILIDSPRFNPVLARRLAALGGVSYIFLTHRDDVADHAKWAKHFGCPRIIHKGEVNEDTAACEIQLEGEGPWGPPETLPLSSGHASASSVPDTVSDSKEGSATADDVTFIWTPGHTEFHVCMYHPASHTLFAGDHLAGAGVYDNSIQTALGKGVPPSGVPELFVYKDFNWWSFPEQLKSVEKLLKWDFLRVLPGHGRMALLKDSSQRMQAVSNLLQRWTQE
ncbi:MAG: hypothetical protein WDW38_009707 [Sanguina aurantia]